MNFKSIGLTVALLAGLVANGVARADVIYDFSGRLATGAPVTGVLSLSDAYTPGAPLAESSGTGGGVFISYLQSISGSADLTLTSADYVLVAGGADPFFSQTADGDGPLPSVPGVPSFADIFIVNSAANLGINDYSVGAGGFFVASNGSVVTGSDGTWTLRSVPEPASLALLGVALAGIGFVRRRC